MPETTTVSSPPIDGPSSRASFASCPPEEERDGNVQRESGWSQEDPPSATHEVAQDEHVTTQQPTPEPEALVESVDLPIVAEKGQPAEGVAVIAESASDIGSPDTNVQQSESEARLAQSMSTAAISPEAPQPTYMYYPQSLTDDHPTLTTFFEGEIIGPKHLFKTTHPSWGSSEKVDLQHWARFPAWRPLAKSAKSPNFSLKNYQQREHLFMRWKEYFLVPDHRVKTITGASFEGFYYICFNQCSGTVSGIYFHAKSEKYQQLELQHVDDMGCVSAVQFRFDWMPVANSVLACLGIYRICHSIPTFMQCQTSIGHSVLIEYSVGSCPVRGQITANMAGPPKKKQKRSDHRATEEGELPQKKYYRQRAHANPFSDHDLPGIAGGNGLVPALPSIRRLRPRRPPAVFRQQRRGPQPCAGARHPDQAGRGRRHRLRVWRPDIRAGDPHAGHVDPRHGDPDVRDGVRAAESAGAAGPACPPRHSRQHRQRLRHRHRDHSCQRGAGPVPERVERAGQHDEVPAQLLHARAAAQGLPVLPGPALQGAQAQGAHRLAVAQLRIHDSDVTRQARLAMRMFSKLLPFLQRSEMASSNAMAENSNDPSDALGIFAFHQNSCHMFSHPHGTKTGRTTPRILPYAVHGPCKTSLSFEQALFYQNLHLTAVQDGAHLRMALQHMHVEFQHSGAQIVVQCCLKQRPSEALCSVKGCRDSFRHLHRRSIWKQ
nr:glucose-induced degradation protein 4 like [Quercus suber]